MNYLHYDLGHVVGGATVQVSLSGNAANVMLLDASNLNKYKRGEKFSFYGGHATRSPVLISVPHSGSWHVAIDMGGYAGNVKASVTVV